MYRLIFATLVSFVTVAALRAADAPASKPAPGSITGKVADPNGEPSAGAQVTLIIGSDEIAQVKCDQNGAFRIDKIPAARGYRLLVSEEVGVSGRIARSAQKADITVAPGKNTDVGEIFLRIPLPTLPH